MLRYRIAALAAVCVSTGPANWSIAPTITPDGDVGDGDDFGLLFDGAFHTLYIWGKVPAPVATVDEFKFDLAPSGGALSFGNAGMGSPRHGAESLGK